MTDQRLVHLTPEQARKQYFESRRGEVREATLSSQSTPVKRFTRWPEEENKTLHPLTGLDIQHFSDHLKDEGYARSTLHHYMTAVRQFLLYLERVEAAPPDIGDKVHRPYSKKVSGSEARKSTLTASRTLWSGSANPNIRAGTTSCERPDIPTKCGGRST